MFKAFELKFVVKHATTPFSKIILRWKQGFSFFKLQHFWLTYFNCTKGLKAQIITFAKLTTTCNHQTNYHISWVISRDRRNFSIQQKHWRQQYDLRIAPRPEQLTVRFLGFVKLHDNETSITLSKQWKSLLISCFIRTLITSLPKAFSLLPSNTYHLINILSKAFINYIVTDLNKLLLLCYCVALHEDETNKEAKEGDWTID